MRRTAFLAVLAVAGAMALPGGATAGSGNDATKVTTGADSSGLEVSFVLKTRNGKPVSVKKFKFSGVELLCDEGILQLGTIRGFPKMKVNRRKIFGGVFSSQHEAGEEIYEVAGKVKKKGKKVVGQLAVSGTFITTDGTVFNNCDSGILDWRTT